MKTAVYQLEPFTCPSCIKKIESALSKQTGVESVKVLFNLGKVKAQFDESKINANNIGEKIKTLGYLVFSTKIS
jgi:copper chaperone CopZ